MEDDELAERLLAELPRLMRLAERIAPPGVEPEDLLQDVVERAWRARAGFRGQARVSTWLQRILVNRAADLARGARGRGDRARLQERAEAGAESEPAPAWAAQLADPALLVQRAEDRRLLRRALTRLTPEERSALVLFDGEDMAAGEVAELLGASPAAIYKRVQRARWRLARELSAGAPSAGRGPVPASCQKALAAAGDYMGGRLAQQARADVEEHLRQCARCPPLVQALVGLRGALRAPDSPPLPSDLRLAVLATLRSPDVD